MGFLSRVLGPPGRLARPAAARNAVARAGAAKSTKDVRHRTSRLRTTLDRIKRSLTRNTRSVDGKKVVAVYRHGTCSVNHRSRKAASNCRRTY
jgi:hypothetical protein